MKTAMLLGVLVLAITVPVLLMSSGWMTACCGASSGHEGHGSHVTAASAPTTAQSQPAVVNTRCPIMSSSKIDPAKVPANLTREFKGQKVGFCCGGCPSAWDKLTDAEKETKLNASK
ncbi:MAG: hypothetical protein HZA50_00400 [Planctomycetes bacterium]|nr:hypothetical protein [Planctomycetota bacterium]